MKAMALALQAICLVSYCSAQNLVPNASFEQGTNEPTGWTHSVAGVMNWETFGRTGQRSISVSGTGGCGTEWRTPCDYKPGKVYMVRTWAMATNATPVRRGYASLGYVVNRYFTPTDDWAEYSYVGVVPNDATASVVRVGHCPLDGTLLFDDVEVRPVFPVHTRDGDYQLGSGEAFRDGHYTFQTQLNRKDGNYSRCLHEHTSRYDTDRWSMATNTWVTYRHSFSPSVFTNARIKATLNWSANSKLVAEVSTNGVEWTETGSAEPLTSGYVITLLQTNLPSHLFPTDQLFVRLRATGDLWLKEYAFEADLPGGPAFMDGRTGFLEQQVPGATVQPLWFSETPAGYALTVELRNPGETDHQLITTCVANGPTGSRDWSLQTTLPSQSTNVVDFILPTAGAGENTVAIQITDTTLNEVLFQGSIPLTVAAMRDSSYGARLTDSPECATWWCEPTYKVNRDRLPPPASWAPGTNGPPSVEISAARNEYEPFQIVLRPTAPLHDVQISVADFSLDEEPGSPGISATNVEICLVDYVPVTQPSDYTGTTGDHPDPLIPVTSSLELAAGQNHPLWITVFVPKETPPGEYQSQITIQSTSSTITVPVRLRVYNFGLSDVTHTRTAFNVRLDSNWYPSTTLEQRRALWDKYMQNFRKHRITPYAAQFMDPLKWSYNGQKFTFDFAAFDTSLTRYLDEFDFNGFNLMELPWNLGGHPRFSPE
ncbi:MAG TPA: glycoside hydrolase domain-containing protein, partial [Clostridia bacterium]|nr:glycoside hydrolase domain-containing protein [Clostridia bacterium]